MHGIKLIESGILRAGRCFRLILGWLDIHSRGFWFWFLTPLPLFIGNITYSSFVDALADGIHGMSWRGGKPSKRREERKRKAMKDGIMSAELELIPSCSSRPGDLILTFDVCGWFEGRGRVGLNTQGPNRSWTNLLPQKSFHFNTFGPYPPSWPGAIKPSEVLFCLIFNWLRGLSILGKG